MSYGALTIAVFVVWVTIGVSLGILMGRRGYSAFGWGVIGAVLGPIAIAVAVFADRAPEASEVIDPGLAGPGPVNVLVGVDGSAEALAAAEAAVALLGDRLGRLTLATVVPRDATSEEMQLGRDRLASVRDAMVTDGLIDALDAATVVLHGAPAKVLTAYAHTEGFDTIALGGRGRGASVALLGSTAEALLRDRRIPLIVGPALPVPAPDQGSAGAKRQEPVPS